MLIELYSAAKEWGQAGLDLLLPPVSADTTGSRRVAPPFCHQCGEPYSGVFFGTFLCSHCQEREWSLAWARAPYRAEGPVREAILHFKYNGQSHYLSPLADWLEEGFRRFAAGENWDGLVPVPLHALRRRQRGFNQAQELAEQLGKRQKIPVLSCLRRRRPTAAQARLSRGPRLRNLLGAFEFHPRFDVEGHNLLLIDDVLTTGATAEACARILLAAGAARVAVLTIARA